LSLKETMRNALLEGYKFRACEATPCATCSKTVTRAAFDMLWYYANPTDELPAGAVGQPIHGGATILVRFPICEKCAPPCGKCQLPRNSAKVKRLTELTSQRVGRPVSGKGYCQHIHFLGLAL